MSRSLLLLDASAFWRLGSPQLDEARHREVADWTARGLAADAARLHSVLLQTGGGADRLSLIQGLGWSADRCTKRSSRYANS